VWEWNLVFNVKEYHRLRVFDSGVVRIIFSEREVAIEGCR
jgi:hypothetical protein